LQNSEESDENVGIGETETRHAVWAFIAVWGGDPFGGPIETPYPYANQILDTTNHFVVPDSCPSVNPIYPSPRQNLPQIFSSEVGTPGTEITFGYITGTNLTVDFKPHHEYFAVFFHVLEIVSVPLDIKNLTSVIPAQFDANGIIIAVIADSIDAPTEESVSAGPVFLLLQPKDLIGAF
jgi:hypothetical protein